MVSFCTVYVSVFVGSRSLAFAVCVHCTSVLRVRHFAIRHLCSVYVCDILICDKVVCIQTHFLCKKTMSLVSTDCDLRRFSVIRKHYHQYVLWLMCDFSSSFCWLHFTRSFLVIFRVQNQLRSRVFFSSRILIHC